MAKDNNYSNNNINITQSHSLATVAQIVAQEDLHADDGKEIVDKDDDNDQAHQTLEQNKQCPQHVTIATLDLEQSVNRMQQSPVKSSAVYGRRNSTKKLLHLHLKR